MDHTKKLKSQLFSQLAVALILIGAISIAAWFLLFEAIELHSLVAVVLVFTIIIVISLFIAEFLTRTVLEPVDVLKRAIMHVAPNQANNPTTSPPNLEAIKTGRELITNLALQVYQLASHDSQQQANEAKPEAAESQRSSIIQAVNVVNHLPLPLFVLNKQRQITHASQLGIEYCGLTTAQLFGSNLEDTIRLTFPGEQTLSDWFDECQNNKVTSTSYWERVAVKLPDQSIKKCDVSAQYNRENPSGSEFIITFFDRTEQYNEDDEALGFVALAAHELRTPLTMLRGYIEVFEDELSPQVDKEHQDFMRKMRVAASQLTIFVNNILNVARVEKNQLMMNLREANWPETLNKILDDMDIRAHMHSITIERNIDPNIPTVGIDTVSIYEVVANLVDNAIKYSKGSKKIIVSSRLDSNGAVETTVQDFGVGIPSSVTSNLFEKFYRNHRTRGKIGGTGLGLYLTKAIISAHDGHVWVQSKEGEGSTFGFSVIPYSQLSEELKQPGNKDIVRQSHGWVKNHSMYRR